MAQLPPESVSAVQTDQATDDRPSPLRLVLPYSEREFPNAFVAVYEHLEGLRENGHTEDADKMNNSTEVSDLIGIATVQNWKLFDAIWSAKVFRRALYHAIGPKQGGPLWLRESVKPQDTEDMCMTLMPHVWKMLFDQAKDFTHVFVDPHSPGHGRILQQISSFDMGKLKVLWSGEGGTLSLDKVISKFFPKPKRGDLGHRSFSEVTKKSYLHSVTILTKLDPGDYVKAFDSLARYAIDQIPLPPFVNWEMLIKLAHEAGRVTKDVLRHIVFWFEGEDHVDTLSLLTAPVFSWPDLLSAKLFAERAPLNSGPLMHEDKSADELASHFVQALFDQIRAGFELDWKDEAAKNLASQTPTDFLRKGKFLSPSLQSVCYRDRFRLPAWRKVFDVYKSYVGSRFQGLMDVYDVASKASDIRPQVLLQSAIEKSILAAGLQETNIPFLQSDEALRGLTSDVEILTAMYLYPRCKLFTIGSHERISSDQTSNLRSDVQHVSPEQDQKVQMILKETTRILRDAGHDPQPDSQDEHLDRFRLRRLGFVLAESNNQSDSQIDEPTKQLKPNAAASAILTGTTPSGAPETLIGEPAVASTSNPSDPPETLTGESVATSINIPSDALETFSEEHAVAPINNSSDPYKQEHQTRSRKRSLPRKESISETLSSTSLNDKQEDEARSGKRYRRK